MNPYLTPRSSLQLPNYQYNNNLANINNLNINNINRNINLANNTNYLPKLKSSYNSSTYNGRLGSINNTQNSKFNLSKSNSINKKIKIINGKKSNSGSLLKSSRGDSYNRVIRYGHRIRNIDINIDPEDRLNEDTDSVTSFHMPKSTLTQSTLNSSGIGTYYNNMAYQVPKVHEKKSSISSFFSSLFFGQSADTNNNTTSGIPLDSDEILN